MWLHYAESHSVFYIEFEQTLNNGIGSYDKCMPVIYDKPIKNKGSSGWQRN